MFVRERKRTSLYTTQASTVPVARGNGSQTNGEGAYLLQKAQGEALYAFAPVTIDAIRYTVTRLLATNTLPKCCAVVSALREEGVTYTALALALTLAHDTERRVAYVDLNWWWPTVRLRTLQGGDQGIVGLLNQTITLPDGLVATNYANLFLLAAGNLAPSQRPVVARSTGLATLIKQLSEEFDHLILDIPALLTTSDAIPLSGLADAACVVVRHGVSTNDLTRQALRQIDHVPALGVILNRSQSVTPSWLLKWIGQE